MKKNHDLKLTLQELNKLEYAISNDNDIMIEINSEQDNNRLMNKLLEHRYVNHHSRVDSLDPTKDNNWFKYFLISKNRKNYGVFEFVPDELINKIGGYCTVKDIKIL